jgi:hypothetical protein
MPNALSASRARPAPRFGSAVRELRKVLRGLFDPYHPERHYMRGPGPKWREKHGDQRPGF